MRFWDERAGGDKICALQRISALRLSNVSEEETMRRISWLLAGTVFLVSFPFAQDRGDFGLNFRVDPQPRIGVSFHISSRFAVRPYIGFSFGSTEVKTEYEALVNPGIIRSEKEQDTASLNFGLGLYYYFFSRRDFNVFTGINFNYSRETLDASYSDIRPLKPQPGITREEEETGEIYQTSALLGLQCRLSKNLSVFGEIGVGYTFGRVEHDNLSETTVKSTRWGLANSGIGIIFYF
jgi:hypothetical protein